MIELDGYVHRRGRPPKHDWDTIVDGKTRRLQRGIDFTAQLLSFRTMVHRKARQLDLKARTHIDESDESIIVQFLPILPT